MLAFEVLLPAAERRGWFQLATVFQSRSIGVVERVFAELKYHSFGHPRFLPRGRGGAQTEISMATMVYNLKRMMMVLGGATLRVALAH